MYRRTMLAGALSVTASALLSGGRASAGTPEFLDVAEPEARPAKHRLHLKMDGAGRGAPVRLPLGTSGFPPEDIKVTSTTGHTRLGSTPAEAGGDRVSLRTVQGKPGEVWVTPRRLGSPGVPADRLNVETRQGSMAVDVWIEPAEGKWYGARQDLKHLDLEIVAVHAALVRRGDGAEVIMYSPSRDMDENGNPIPEPGRPGKWKWQTFHMGNVESRSLDLATLKTRNRPMTGTNPKNLFCSGQAQLPDGRLLVAGGHIDPAHKEQHDDAKHVHIYSATAEDGWSHAGDMGVYRWYPTITTMPDGRMLITSGSSEIPTRIPSVDSGPNGYFNNINNDYQLYDPARGLLTPQDGRLIDPALFRSAEDRLATFPNVFVLPGASDTALPIIAMVESNRAWFFQYDAARDAPLVLARQAYYMHGKGSRSYPTYGAHVLLPLRPGSPRQRILVVGGQDVEQTNHRDLSGDQKTTATAEILDVDVRRRPDRQPGWRKAGSMRHARVLCDATLMADGKVLISGGSRRGWGDINKDPVYQSEIFDPDTETFHPAASALTDRRYHATALLQPDGTVLKAGSTGGFAIDIETGESLFDEHTTAERFYPPYLFRGPRPAITRVAGGDAAWTDLSYDRELSVQARGEGLDGMSRVALVRFGSTTHGNNMDQRFVWLQTMSQESASGDDWTIRVRTPKSPAVAPPGQYMLFVVDSSGIPSQARFVQLGPGTT